MAFWIGMVVMGWVVTVLIVESRPVRRRLERWSGGGAGPWGGEGGDGGGWGGDGGGCGDGGGGC
jgi:hypothetical protein